MLIRKDQDLNGLETEVFDILVGIEDEEKKQQKKAAISKTLQTRRAIEYRKEQQELESQINDELWFDDL